MCAMESYADAVVGQVGEGLNVEQRKVRTIDPRRDSYLTVLLASHDWRRIGGKGRFFFFETGCLFSCRG